MSSIPSSWIALATVGSGLGVILSIMDQGKLTFDSSQSHVTNSCETMPISAHLFAMVETPVKSLKPFCEQLSMLTTAIGKAPALNLSLRRETTMQQIVVHFSGPLRMSS